MSSPSPSASVLVPTFQGAEFLERQLAALRAQDLDRPWDLLAIDSGSSDGTLEILERQAADFPVPLRVRRIDPVEFDHGDTRNLLAAWSEGEILVYLTQDAIPSGPEWLRTLLANFRDPAVAAVTCRNVARPEADLLTRVFSETDPGYSPERREVRLPDAEAYAALDAHQRRLLYNFNDVASAIRRDAWERHPFPRTSFGEDVLMARALLEDGWTVVHDGAATVEHSHDYGPEECRERARIDGRFNAEWLDRVCVASREDAGELVRRQLVRDREALAAAGVAGQQLERELVRAEELRRATFLGLWEGGRSERRRPATRVLPGGALSILYVLHGFPPDTWAGTEVYTLNLAREMQRRGHRVAILCRAPAERPESEGGDAELSVREDEFAGLRVLRMVHRLEHGRLRESYDHPAAVEAFREVLLRERPDLVHFQHLIHLSAGIVRQAREFNLPTVLHCHDYWALCARVQMIRPGGVRCDENMGSGCYLCVSERGLSMVDRLRRFEQRSPEPVAALRERDDALWSGFADLADRQEFVLEAYRGADLLISPSRFLRDKLIEAGGLEPETLLFSDNGLRTDLVDALRKEPDPDGRVRFGFVGSLVWYKGCEVLIEAMNRLAGKPCVLSVYGDYRPEEDPYHARLRDLVRADNVEFCGRFDNQRLSEVYAGIDALVVPSIWFENSPITIHEAFLARTPVVASDIGGMAEYVRDGVDGLQFAVGDAEDLARKLERLVDEPGLLGRLGQDFFEVKSITDNARETEFRYRALCARVRDVRPRLLLDLAGHETSATRGPVEPQGANLLLLRPGGARVEYDLSLARGGRRSVRVELIALAGESAVELGGRVHLDGRQVAAIEPFRAGEEDELRAVEFEAELADGAGQLTLDTRGAGGEAYLRVQRITVQDAAAPGVGATP